MASSYIATTLEGEVAQQAISALCLLSLVAMGCGTDAPPGSSTPTMTEASEPRTSSDVSEEVPPTPGLTLPPTSEWPATSAPLPPCNDQVTGGEAACAAGFVIGSVTYDISCGQIRPEFVTSERIADGLYAVNVVRGFDPRVVIAYRDQAQRCNEGPDEESRQAWHFAFAPDRPLPPDREVCSMQDFDRPGQPVPDVCATDAPTG